MKNTIVASMPALAAARCGYRVRERLLYAVRSVVASGFVSERCLCCGSACVVLPICSACAQSLCTFMPLFSASYARCKICGKLLVSEQERCMHCRAQRVLTHTDGVFPLHSYQLWKKSLLHAWKMENRRTLSPLFAAIIQRALHELYAQLGTELPIVPIPPRPGKIRRTGWDQIDELCAHVCRGYGIPRLALLRRLSRVQQKSLDREGRLQVLGAAYTLSCRAKRLQLQGRLPAAVVLIDDVLTTGATIETCARVLKAAGVKRVYAITLFAVE